MTSRPKQALWFIAAAVAGCTVGPDYVRPPDDVPAAFSRTIGQAPVLASTAWWRTLNDPILNDLVDKARQANPDLARARAAVAEARAALAHAESGSSPQLNSSASATYGRLFAPPGTANPPAVYAADGFDASWEIDVWGRDRRLVQAAAANAEAAEAGADDAMLTLLGDVARIYVELRGAQAQVATTQVSIENQHRANALTARRLHGGDGTRMAVLQGEALLLQQQSLLPALEAQAQVAVNALSTLCGDAPAALTQLLTPPGPIPQAPIPAAGIPAELIRRRPDIRAAERQLAASVALIGAATAERYPSLSLSGNLSFSGNAIGSILALPLFMLSPTLSLPIVDGGRRVAAVDIRTAQAEQARLYYRGAVLRALREVEDAMARLRGETLRRDQLKLTVAMAQRVVDSARTLYAAGVTDFLQVIDAQRGLNQSRDGLDQAEAGRTIQMVALFKALGGGWQVDAANP